VDGGLGLDDADGRVVHEQEVVGRPVAGRHGELTDGDAAAGAEV
jgi:hypothetical protein